MAKKKNSRKALAAALAIVGVAGLSMASASQLTVNVDSPNIATGLGAFDAACDDAVDVAFTTVWNNTDKRHDIDEIVVSDIALACDGLDLEWYLFEDGEAVAIDSGSESIGGTSVTIDLAPNVSGLLDLEDIAITIS